MSEEPLSENFEKLPALDKSDSYDLPLSKEIQTLIGELPEQQQMAFQEAIALQIERTSWRGPLPPPDVLIEYNKAVPDGAERILRMAEKQSQHRMDMEKTVIPEDQRQSKRGQMFAFIVALAFLAASAVLIGLGQGVYGTILGGVDLVALVYVFIHGKKEQDSDE